jgi:hypothetical protein
MLLRWCAIAADAETGNVFIHACNCKVMYFLYTGLQCFDEPHNTAYWNDVQEDFEKGKMHAFMHGRFR